MLHISSYLDRIKDRHLKGRIEIERISEIIGKNIGGGVKIHFSKIKIVSNKIQITQAHPLVKNQIALHKSKILAQINSELGKKLADIY
jgi:hypothetical protein